MELAYVSAAIKKLRDNVDETDLQTELNISVGTGKTTVSTNTDDTLNVYFTDTEHNYNVDNGTVSKVNIVDPSVEYNYADKEGVVDASTLIEGDLINYYYDKTKAPIPCVVLYNDNVHGLQVISVESVRNVILGYDEDLQDSKVVSAFASTPPARYGTSDFEKYRWSYNHTLQTLNEYARDYLGQMAISARCIGSPSNNIVTSEDETTNMYETISSYTYLSSYNEKFKNGDNNVNNDIENNANEDLNKMNSLGIIQISEIDEDASYWVASRKINSDNFCTTFVILNISYGVIDYGTTGTVYADGRDEEFHRCEQRISPNILTKDKYKNRKNWTSRLWARRIN